MFLCFSMYHQSVPKPWTGSSSTASWAPIRAPTTTSTRQESSAAASSSSTGEEAHTEEKKLSGARNGTSLPNESSSKSDLEQAIQDLDSFMVEDSVTVMQDSCQEENNNEASEARTKMTAAQVQEVDDLTKQLMEALDTNEVIEKTATKQSPFGKSMST